MSQLPKPDVFQTHADSGTKGPKGAALSGLDTEDVLRTDPDPATKASLAKGDEVSAQTEDVLPTEPEPGSKAPAGKGRSVEAPQTKDVLVTPPEPGSKGIKGA